MSEHTSDINAETTVHKYQDDKDFDEAFKNLLQPIESITKKSYSDSLQYNLLKELDSYLNHLKKMPDSDSSVFVEAALMIQNVILIYQKRVDQYVDRMATIVAKFRAYRSNLNGIGNNLEIEKGSKRSKKEKKVKFYPSFEPLKIVLNGPIKTYDCKLIDISKKPCVPKIVLNANIKVDNKFSKLLPHILMENGENIGKKYDFMLNCNLNRHLAVNEEFDFSTNDKSNTLLSYQNHGVPLTMYMDVDGVNPDDKLPATPDPVVFDQTINDVPYTGALPSENIIDISKIHQITNDLAWSTVVNDNAYSNKPIIHKEMPKKEDHEIWLPSYTMTEICCQEIKLKSDITPDPEFRQIVYNAQKVVRSEIAIKRTERMKADAEKQYCDEEMENNLENNYLLGLEKGFENGDVDYNFNDNFENQEKVGDNADGFLGYQKNAMDIQRHEQNQLEIMNDQLKMRKRVETWHNNLRPILEAEEKKTEFDVHEYGTKVLDCFEEIGEQKLFKDLVGGLEQEEVARYFLSTLMMANTHNVKITNSEGDNDGSTRITLLNKERHHEQLQVNIGNQVNQDLK